MASSHLSIAPFPSDIDRDAFGHHLSGLTAGEGCFDLSMHVHRAMTAKQKDGTTYRNCLARFTIKLRDDDMFILKLIQSYWRVGKLYHLSARTSKHRRSNPQSHFQVFDSRELAAVIVPHFERYPMWEKKQRDFLIWREGVELMREIATRKRKILLDSAGRSLGRAPSWTNQERETFIAIKKRLMEQRRYVNKGVILPAQISPQPTTRQHLLFQN